jgi:hypothetical protein
MAKKTRNIDIEEDIWLEAKIEALKEGITLQEWVSRAIQRELEAKK